MRYGATMANGSRYHPSGHLRRMRFPCIPRNLFANRMVPAKMKTILILAIISAFACEAAAQRYVYRYRVVQRGNCPNGQCPAPAPVTIKPAGDGTLPLQAEKVEPTKPTTEAQKWAEYKVRKMVRSGRCAHVGGWIGRFEGVGMSSGSSRVGTCTPCGRSLCEGCGRCGTPRGDARAYSVRTRSWYRVRIW